jgi:hypothetical protein
MGISTDGSTWGGDMAGDEIKDVPAESRAPEKSITSLDEITDPRNHEQMSRSIIEQRARMKDIPSFITSGNAMPFTLEMGNGQEVKSKHAGDENSATAVSEKSRAGEVQTKSDVAVVGDIKSEKQSDAPPAKQNHDLSGDMQKVFGRVDTDHDGIVSADEMNAAVKDSQFNGEDAKSVTAMKWAFEQLQNADGKSEDGISQGDLTSFKNLEQAHDSGKGEQAAVKRMESAYRSTELSQKFSDGGLYGGRDVKDSIKPSAVEQGTSGDCFFMASVAALAATNPEAIANMIKDNGVDESGKHTYTVTFPGADKPITVEAPTDSELTLYAHGNQHGTWPAVLEKAYGEYTRGTQWFPDENLPAAKVMDGGKAHNVMEVLTGKDYTFHTMNFNDTSELHTQLTLSMHPQTGDALPVTLALVGGTNEFGLKGPHEYAVVGYDPVTQEAILRDPRGEGYGPKYEDGKPIPWMQGKEPGTFKMTLDEMKRVFGRVAVASSRDS